MKTNFLSNKLTLTLGLIFCFATNVASAQIVYSNGFENLALGNASDSDITTSWNSRYAKGPDEGRVNIVSTGKTGKGASIKYPAYGNQSTPSGATWETDISYSGDELYMSYWVKFDANFDFVKGGKLPGLGGSTEFPYGSNGFTTRLMWREGGKLEFYLHGYQINNSSGAEPYRLFWDTSGYHASVIPGRWHHIEIRQKLNTPGNRDGILQGWLDGVLVCDDSDNSGVRATGASNTKINHLYFSTFFGGSSAPQIQWQPTRDVFATFDDFIVSTKFIGMDTQAGSNNGSSASSSSRSSSSSSRSSSSSSSSRSSSSANSCLSLTTGTTHEINIANNNCVQFDRNLSGKTLSVWDSDVNNSCDFRGKLMSVDGSGTLNVPDNYEAASNLTGTKVKIESSNGCKYLKVRSL